MIGTIKLFIRVDNGKTGWTNIYAFSLPFTKKIKTEHYV